MPWSTGHAARSDLWTVFGWQLMAGDTQPAIATQFPHAGNGAEMLRMACCLATERGSRCAHQCTDAVLIAARWSGSKPTSRPCKRPWRKPRRRSGRVRARHRGEDLSRPISRSARRGDVDAGHAWFDNGSGERRDLIQGVVIVPVIWWHALIRMQATGTTLWVALLLLDKARRAPYPLVKLSNGAAKPAGQPFQQSARHQSIAKSGADHCAGPATSVADR